MSTLQCWQRPRRPGEDTNIRFVNKPVIAEDPDSMIPPDDGGDWVRIMNDPYWRERSHRDFIEWLFDQPLKLP